MLRVLSDSTIVHGSRIWVAIRELRRRCMRKNHWHVKALSDVVISIDSTAVKFDDRAPRCMYSAVQAGSHYQRLRASRVTDLRDRYDAYVVDPSPSCRDFWTKRCKLRTRWKVLWENTTPSESEIWGFCRQHLATLATPTIRSVKCKQSSVYGVFWPLLPHPSTDRNETQTWSSLSP